MYKNWRIWNIDSAVQDNAGTRYHVFILALLFRSTHIAKCLQAPSSLTSTKMIGQPFVVWGARRRPPSNRTYWNRPLIPCTLSCPFHPSSSLLLFLWRISGFEMFCVECKVMDVPLREGYTATSKFWNVQDIWNPVGSCTGTSCLGTHSALTLWIPGCYGVRHQWLLPIHTQLFYCWYPLHIHIISFSSWFCFVCFVLHSLTSPCRWYAELNAEYHDNQDFHTVHETSCKFHTVMTVIK
jgi:hypothetical protein